VGAEVFEADRTDDLHGGFCLGLSGHDDVDEAAGVVAADDEFAAAEIEDDFGGVEDAEGVDEEADVEGHGDVLAADDGGHFGGVGAEFGLDGGDFEEVLFAVGFEDGGVVDDAGENLGDAEEAEEFGAVDNGGVVASVGDELAVVGVAAGNEVGGDFGVAGDEELHLAGAGADDEIAIFGNAEGFMDGGGRNDDAEVVVEFR